MADDVKDLMWLAGLLEGEGCFAFSRRHNGKYIYYILQLIMTDEDVVERAASILGVKCTKQALITKGGKNIYRACAQGPYALGWMIQLYPHMGKRRQAKIDECLTVWKLDGAKIHRTKLEKHHPGSITLKLLEGGGSPGR